MFLVHLGNSHLLSKYKFIKNIFRYNWHNIILSHGSRTATQNYYIIYLVNYYYYISSYYYITSNNVS